MNRSEIGALSTITTLLQGISKASEY
uniref:Uncharacterized protein n=1 Tax=Arundo donax TaxID=35708 RepID=A0A0A8YV37_ARUDO